MISHITHYFSINIKPHIRGVFCLWDDGYILVNIMDYEMKKVLLFKKLLEIQKKMSNKSTEC